MEETSLSDFLEDGAAADAPDEETDEGDAVEESGAGGDAAEEASAGGDAAKTAAGGAAGEARGADSSLPDSDTVDPAVTTASWRPDGVACPACGEAVGWRWRDVDGESVCADCLDWDRV